MKNGLIFIFLLITIGGYCQVNRFSQPVTPAKYQPVSFDEMMVVAQHKRAAYDQNQEYLYNMKKWLLELKAQITEESFLNRINGQYTFLTSMEDDDLSKATKVLKQREIEIREIISDYNRFIEKYNSNQSSSTSQKPSSPNSSEELTNKAVSEFKAQNYQEAFKLSSVAIAENPNSFVSFYIRAYTYYYGFNNYQKAIEDFEMVIQLSNTFPDSHYLKGLCHYNIGEFQEAIISFSAFLQNDNTNTDVYFVRAMAKSEVGDLFGAIRDYDKIIELNSSYPMQNNTMATIYNNKAYCMVQQKKFTEALPLVNEALKLDKGIGYIWDTRGEIYYELGNYKESIKDMDKSLSIEKSDNSYFIRGLAKIKLGQKNDGCNDLSTAGEMGKKEAYTMIQNLCY